MRNTFSKILKSEITSLVVGVPAMLVASGALAFENTGGPAMGIVGAASVQNPSVKTGGSKVDVDGKTAFGAGITFEVGVREGMGLEADLLYLNHKFKRSEIGGVTSTVSSGYLQLPVLLRYRPIPYLNLGAGGYYSRITKNWSVSTSNASAGLADYKKDDFGFVAAVGTNIPVGEALSIIADLRYARSLTDSARNSGDDLKYSDFQFLAGVRFGF